jgi:hypothetical protein
MSKRALTKEDLARHLKEQIGFIQRSVAAFDEGYEDEAKRLALTVRVMVHDTKKCASLFTQLGMKNSLQFCDSAWPHNQRSLISYGGLVCHASGAANNTLRYLAFLDHSPFPAKNVDFDEWWNALVFSKPDNTALSRRDLVLTVADQDGGAHVDPAIDEIYATLVEGSFLGWETKDDEGNTFQIAGPERAAIRQIAHEMLRTLKPDIEPVSPKDIGVIIGGISFVEGAETIAPPTSGLPVRQSANDLSPEIALNRVGRNQQCPCGSGKKFKYCHGAFR